MRYPSWRQHTTRSHDQQAPAQLALTLPGYAPSPPFAPSGYAAKRFPCRVYAERWCSAAGGAAAEGQDLLDFNGPVDRVWGIAGGKLAAVRLPEEGGSCILFVDIATASVAHEAAGLHKDAVVDPATGNILEPARASAFLERSSDGQELQVSRALPDDQWVTFGHRGILKVSSEAGHAV